MRLRLVTPLALLALTLPLAACGESEQDKYVDEFSPLNDQLLTVGRDLSRAVQGADTETDATLQRQFSRLAKRLRALNDDIAELDTPADLDAEAKALNEKLDATVGDLEDIAKAAADGDAQAAAAATVKLSSDSQEVNAAQNKLARATGAAVGDN